jgi:Chromate transporter
LQDPVPADNANSIGKRIQDETRLCSQGLTLFESFYRAGSLVFGGGHVVLPLLQASVVPPGWVINDVFLAGYGAAQAVPGPLFIFAVASSGSPSKRTKNSTSASAPTVRLTGYGSAT